MGAAVSNMEKQGIKTNIGNLNRDIKEANRLMQSVKQMIRNLKGWITDLNEKKAALLKELEQTREPTVPELLLSYLNLIQNQAQKSPLAKHRKHDTDSDKIMQAANYLNEKDISTVESLDTYLDNISKDISDIDTDIKESEKRIKTIDTMIFHIKNYRTNKPVYNEYTEIRWKKKKEKFAASHQKELDVYNNAVKYFKSNLKDKKYNLSEMNKEREKLSDNILERQEQLSKVHDDIKILRDVRLWINHVLLPEQYKQPPELNGRKSVVNEIKNRAECIEWQEEQSRKSPHQHTKDNQEHYLQFT